MSNRARRPDETWESYREWSRMAKKVEKIKKAGVPVRVTGRTTPKRDKQRRKAERARLREWHRRETKKRYRALAKLAALSQEMGLY